ncbi:AfsR/SARP family transcriptional regulator [Labrys neptuniae]
MDVNVQLLGRFSVTVDGQSTTETDWRRSRSVTLVKLLALAPRHRLHREQVMETLWPDLAPEAAAANLRKAVHFARQTLQAAGMIGLNGEVLSLAPEAALTIDLERYEAAAAAALKARDPVVCAELAGSYGGELLPDDRYAEWTQEPRDRLQALHIQVLKCAGLWQEVVKVDPLDQDAVRVLMRSALDGGNRSEAIRLFQTLRERLRVDMGLGPDRSTVSLYEQAVAPGEAEPKGIDEHVRGLMAWGIVHLHSGDFLEAERKAEEARSLALAGGLGREIGEASALVGLVAHMQGRWQSLFRSEFVKWVRQPAPTASNVFDGHLCLAEFCLCNARGHADMANLSHELLTIAQEVGSAHGQALATLILGKAALFSGRLDEAEDFLTRADELHAQAGALVGRALALHRLAEVALARGQRWKAGRLLQKGLNIAEQTWLTPHLLIRYTALAVEVATDIEQVGEAIRHGDRLISEESTCQPCSMGFRVASAIALAEAGETEQAGRRIDEAERIAGMWQGGPWVASVWEARGVLRQAQGIEGQATALFQEAAARFGDLARARDQERCLARAKAVYPVNGKDGLQ